MKETIKAEAFRLGFVLFGVTTPQTPPHFPEYKAWVDHGRNAGMAYLASERHIQARQDPAVLLPEVRCIVCLALPYADPNSAEVNPSLGKPVGRISSYAWGRDYHDVLDEKVQALATEITRLAEKPVPWKAFTDKGPVMEKDLAQRAGLGWVGKNTLLINPNLGSYFFLTELLLDLDLPVDQPFETDHCGTCRKCIAACPTDAIREDRTLEAGRCISYLTIEDKGETPVELQPGIGEWVFGCDICQMVCPWNLRFAGTPADPALESDRRSAYQDLEVDLSLDEAAFKEKFRGRAFLRPKRFGHLRNVLVVMGNQALSGSIDSLERVLREEADQRLRILAVRALGASRDSHARGILEYAARFEENEEIRDCILAVLADA